MSQKSFNDGVNDANHFRPTGPQRPNETKDEFNDRSAGNQWQRQQQNRNK